MSVVRGNVESLGEKLALDFQTFDLLTCRALSILDSNWNAQCDEVTQALNVTSLSSHVKSGSTVLVSDIQISSLSEQMLSALQAALSKRVEQRRESLGVAGKFYS